MSHWIRVCETVDTKNKNKNYGAGVGVIRRSKRVKIHGSMRVVENPPFAFKRACEKVGVPMTRRQLSKWNHHKGQAYRGKA